MRNKLVDMLNNDVTLYWTRTQIFILIEAVAIPLVATQIREKITATAGCVISIVIAVIWFFVLKVINKWLQYWHKKLAEFELAEPQQPIKIFADEEFERKINEKLEIFNVMKALIVVFISIWVLLAVRALFTL